MKLFFGFLWIFLIVYGFTLAGTIDYFMNAQTFQIEHCTECYDCIKKYFVAVHLQSHTRTTKPTDQTTNAVNEGEQIL